MSHNFEHIFGNLLTGAARAIVRDPNGVAPRTIIQSDHDFEVQARWFIAGRAAPFIGGVWRVRVVAESIGPGPEKQVGNTETVPLLTAPPLPSRRNYEATVKVAAGSLPPGAAYELVVLITYEHDGFPLEMAAYVELPLIQVYEGLPA